MTFSTDIYGGMQFILQVYCCCCCCHNYRQNQLSHQKPSRVGYGWRQRCLGSLSRKWVPGYRQRWQLYLDYPCRLEVCKRVYTGTPQGVEQVMDVTGLPGVMICKALWASFGKEKALYKNCILLLLYDHIMKMTTTLYNVKWRHKAYSAKKTLQNQRTSNTSLGCLFFFFFFFLFVCIFRGLGYLYRWYIHEIPRIALV